MSKEDSWEVVCTSIKAGVKRFPVPGGWLYRVYDSTSGHFLVVFVSDPALSR
jgi:hypothetical protein